MNIQKEHLHASRSYEELNDVCFEGFLTLGGGSKNDNSQKFNSLRNAGQVNMQLILTSFYRVCQTISYEIWTNTYFINLYCTFIKQCDESKCADKTFTRMLILNSYPFQSSK